MVAKFWITTIGLRLSDDDRDSNEEGKKKTNRFRLAKQLFFVLFLAVVARLRHETS